MYKIVFIDLDGTLLNTEKEIGERTIKALQKLKNKAEIVITTGRSYSYIMPFLKAIGIADVGHTICLNGSCIVDNKTQQKLIDEYIERDRLIMLQEWLNAKHLQNVRMATFSDYYSIDTMINENVYKVVVRDNKEIIEELISKIPSDYYGIFEIFKSEYEVCDFNKKGISKKYAIEKLLSILNIDKEYAVALGDGGNDIEMLKYVGLGIAMGNAFDNVKKCAKMITDTNDNDGVGKALEKIFDLDK